jgi:hypothetical protein
MCLIGVPEGCAEQISQHLAICSRESAGGHRPEREPGEVPRDADKQLSEVSHPFFR